MLNAGRTIAPRVGGVEGNIAWTGGSNVRLSSIPKDVRCFRPTDFRSRQEQDKVLKQGIAEELKLTLIDENESKGNTQTVSGWIDEIKFLIETNGMDTVFRIYDWNSREIYMLDNWGSIKLKDVEKWVSQLKQKKCPFDEQNLRLSAILIRNSISNKVKQQITATANIANISCPELFIYTIQQRTIMSAAHIKTISNKLGDLSLSDIPGEHVPDLTKRISDYDRQLVGSGKQPSDLINLVSKPYTTGSVEIFKSNALTIHTQVLRGTYPYNWERLVSDHNNMYYDLIQTNDYPPATGKKQNKEDDLIQCFIGQIDIKFSKLEESLKTKIMNVVKNHGNNQNSSTDTNWRTVAPKNNEPNEKVVNGITYKYCAKYCRGKGYWTSGDSLHGTDEHDPTKFKKRETIIRVTMNQNKITTKTKVITMIIVVAIWQKFLKILKFLTSILLILVLTMQILQKCLSLLKILKLLIMIHLTLVLMETLVKSQILSSMSLDIIIL